KVNTSNAMATDVTAVTAPPDLTITKTHSSNFIQGQTGVYTITVTNLGGAPTSGAVTVSDTLPTGLTATAFGGAGWDCVLATLTCTRNDPLPPGGSYSPITVTVNVAIPTPSGRIFGSAYNGPDGPATLSSLSRANGSAAPIGPIGFAQMGALDFSPAGILYGEGVLNGTHELLTINTATGVGTALGPTGLSDPFQDIA